MSGTVLYEVKEGIALITLNRMEYGNAFSETSYTEIAELMTKASEDPEVKAIIFTGAGKIFSAGGDVKYFKKMIDEGKGLREEDVLLTGDMVKSVTQNKKPVIAAINGIAAGAGAGLALACDFIFMGEHSQILTAFMNMAYPGDTLLVYSLQQAIGTFRTKRHVMLNEPINAELAVAYGLAQAVVPDDQLMEKAFAFAQQLAALPTLSLGYQKEFFSEIFYPDMDNFNQKEGKYMALASRSEDHKEAVNAFLEKRKPQFKGK